ncbi:hypothetical protein D3OALGA1CA_5611 [Olavius algarvensis associated proteobacterium Delta 3]|nr:hypothetical protein D3OALGA1CA_5611 [Olavius algarvensis associated proteobacterium Delta 3]
MELRCSELSFTYPGTTIELFDRLSFTMGQPGFHALIGPSGVGKTSLARMITGDITGFSGVLETDGMQGLLYSYNLERLPGWSGVGKHLEKITPPGKHSLRDDLIEVFGIRSVTRARFSQLSLGQQNRVNLIRSLLQDFHLLIMDESLANVDEMTRETILLKIKDLFPDTFFLYISYNVIEVSKFCAGILVFRGPGKSPQAVTVPGQDYRIGRTLDKDRLEGTMLEVMNAAA